MQEHTCDTLYNDIEYFDNNFVQYHLDPVQISSFQRASKARCRGVVLTLWHLLRRSFVDAIRGTQATVCTRFASSLSLLPRVPNGTCFLYELFIGAKSSIS